MSKIITQEQVEGHLGGITPYIDALGAQGTSQYTESIAEAEADFQRRTRVLLTLKTIRMDPVAGATYDLLEDPYPLHRAMSSRPIRVVLRHRPIVEILDFRLAFNITTEILTFPSSWIRTNKRLGIATIIPFGAAAPAMAAAGASMWLPVLGRGAWPGDVMPQLIHIDYTAGYEDAATNDALADVRHYVATDAAARVLQACRRAIPDSIQLDGFTQTFTPVQQILEDLRKESKEYLQRFEGRERPLVVGIL